MDGDAPASAQQVSVARYFEMWNTGQSSVALEILTPAWVDHAHPEVTGPDAVRQSVEKIRAARPGLRFHVKAVHGDGDLVSVVGSVGDESGPDETAGGLIWLIRLEGERMAEMWTYRSIT